MWLSTMSTVDVATLKARAEEFVAKAIAGEATLIEQNGKRAVLLPCQGIAPDFALDPETDRLLRQRVDKSNRGTDSGGAAHRRGEPGRGGSLLNGCQEVV